MIENYEKARKISDKIIEFAKNVVKRKISILEMANIIERKIFELGAKPAWPVNISINEVAAHYTPSNFDNRTFLKEDDLVKVDIGVHINGYIWDRAFSFSLGNDKTNLALIKTCEKSLKEAEKIIKAGIRIEEISEAIQSVVESNGFNVVRNLCGHRLDKYTVHAEPIIPNYKTENKRCLEINNVYAIEIFVTNGSGWVKEVEEGEIFQFLKYCPTRMPEEKTILKIASEDFEKMPFAKRWIKIPSYKLDLAIKNLVKIKGLKPYHILKEISNSKVAQIEETFLIK